MTKVRFDEISCKNFLNAPINIKDYYTTFDPNMDFVKSRQKKAEFVKYAWLDLTGYEPDDERLNNMAVRAEQNLGDGIDDIAHSYVIEGWDMGHFPPIVGTDGVPRDGRTRILAAIKCGQNHIPCAIYSYKDNDSVRINKSNGLLANKHHLARRAKWHDFISTGVEIILAGEMACDVIEIEKWLHNECDIEYFYSNVGGNITKLSKQIYDKAKRSAGGHLVVLRERNDWLLWLENSIQKHAYHYDSNFGIRSVDDVAFYESGGNRPEQTFCRHILTNSAKGNITNIVLYSKEDDPDILKYNHNFYMEELERFHTNMYNWINNEVSGIKLIKPEKSQLWRIVGFIPQLYNEEHKKLLKEHRLTSIKDFKAVTKLSLELDIDELDEAA